MIALKVSEHEARIALDRVPHQRFQKAIRRNWRVAEGGTVDARSVCWLFCWAKTGMGSLAAAEEAQQAFDHLLPFAYDRFDAAVDHEWARIARYANDGTAVEKRLETQLLEPVPTNTLDRGLIHPLEGWLTPPQAAAMLGVDRVRVHQMVDEGKFALCDLRVVGAKRVIIIREGAVEEMAAARTGGAPARL